MFPPKLKVQQPAPRLDVWLSENLPGVSRRRARQLCEAGQVFINGYVARAGAFLNQGSIVEVRASIEPASARNTEVVPDSGTKNRSLQVVFEDEFLLVVRKPRGMSSVTLSEEDPLTLADVLVTYGPQQKNASPDPREAGLLQRLDFWTSGLLLAAKSRPMWERLRKELFEEKIHKSYVALVESVPKKDHFVIESPLIASPDEKQMQVAPRSLAGALSATSEVQLLEAFSMKDKPFSLLRVQASRARRHQIRVHLASIGHPLIGDELYGAKRDIRSLPESLRRRVALPHEGFLLHAESLSFRHPVTSKEMNLKDTPRWAEGTVS